MFENLSKGIDVNLGLPVCMRCEESIYSFSLDKIAAEEDGRDEVYFSKRRLFCRTHFLPLPNGPHAELWRAKIARKLPALVKRREAIICPRTHSLPFLRTGEPTIFNSFGWAQILVAFVTSGRLALCRSSCRRSFTTPSCGLIICPTDTITGLVSFRTRAKREYRPALAARWTRCLQR
jgi:hypothetical protein